MNYRNSTKNSDGLFNYFIVYRGGIMNAIAESHYPVSFLYNLACQQQTGFFELILKRLDARSLSCLMRVDTHFYLYDRDAYQIFNQIFSYKNPLKKTEEILQNQVDRI
jgi:hypothetical protein